MDSELLEKFNLHNVIIMTAWIQSANFLASSASRLTGKEKKDNIEYAAWAADQISQKYKVSGYIF